MQQENKKILKNLKQWHVVLIILLVSITIAVILHAFKPEAKKKSVKNEFPQADFIVAKKELMTVPVVSQGTVKAKTYIKLIAEVSGRINHMAKLKFNGGFFEKGELLLSIEDVDYQLAMTRAKAKVAAAQQKLIRVETEAGQARYDLKQIGRDPSKSTSYALREPQLAEAKANLQAAHADLEISRLQMKRTQVIAPFNGRVVSKQVDAGQFVNTGALLANIYSTESVTIRLPLSLPQTELLGIKLRNQEQTSKEINIQLFNESKFSKYQWSAEFSHTEGEIDVRNRLVYLVADIDSPYAKSKMHPNRPPLTPGLFVKAKLTGVKKKLIKLPRSALRLGQSVWVIDAKNKLQKKNVKVLIKDESYIYIEEGINGGEKIITNAIDYPVNNMFLSPLAIETKNKKDVIGINE